jgi:hypothetical protein
LVSAERSAVPLPAEMFHGEPELKNLKNMNISV